MRARLISLLRLVLQVWPERWRQRIDLGELDARMRKDIGLSQADVLRESGKPFWRR
ncbi:MAG: DUF1127 domain-containing protein [Rhodospirillaceae bacterium]